MLRKNAVIPNIFTIAAKDRPGETHEFHDTPQGSACAGGRSAQSPRAQADPVLAPPGGLGRRRHRGDRHLHPDRRRGRTGRTGGHAGLRHCGDRLRLRRPGLRRTGDHDPGIGFGLHLFLHHPGRGGGLDGRVEPDPGIHRGLLRSGRGLGGLLLRHDGGDRHGPARRADLGAVAGRHRQPARRDHRRHQQPSPAVAAQDVQDRASSGHPWALPCWWWSRSRP